MDYVVVTSPAGTRHLVHQPNPFAHQVGITLCGAAPDGRWQHGVVTRDADEASCRRCRAAAAG
jgi:hypothetical protein